MTFNQAERKKRIHVIKIWNEDFVVVVTEEMALNRAEWRKRIYVDQPKKFGIML